MITVYHSDDFRETCMARPGEIDEMLNAGKLTYSKVATVNTGNLDVAYAKTNTFDRYWWENPEVTKHFKEEGARSTSCGDVMVLEDGTAMVVASFGFKQLEYWKTPD